MPKLVKKPIEQLGKVALVILSLGSLSACVTQNFAEEKPVVERDYSDTQIARTRISLALGYLQMGNMTQAKYNLEKAKQFSPDLPDVYTAFAHYYETVGEFEQTEEAYLQALSLADDNADTLNNFGVFLCRQGRVDEAETHFMRAIEVPTYVNVSATYENIALCHLKEGNFDKAEKALNRSVLHSPNSASSLLQMAQIQYAKGQYKKSSDYLGRFELATRRFTPQAIALAYKVNKKMGNKEVADSYGTMLLKMFPDSQQAQAFIDNGLVQIEADNLAMEYRKYRLIKSGVKINKKPIVVTRKGSSQNEAFKQTPPTMLATDNKLVADATIAKQTGQSIASNSQIDKQSKPVAASNTTTPTTTQNKPVSAPAANVASNVTTTQSPAKQLASVKPALPSVNAVVDYPVHVVEKGENLYQVSLKYNIMISSLRRWNDLKEETIHVGQVLRLTKP